MNGGYQLQGSFIKTDKSALKIENHLYGFFIDEIIITLSGIENQQNEKSLRKKMFQTSVISKIQSVCSAIYKNLLSPGKGRKFKVNFSNQLL